MRTERQKELERQWRLKNKDHRAAVKHAWYMKNRDRLIAKQKQYAKDHKEEANLWHREKNGYIINQCKEIKGDKCQCCGSVEDLHFHHIDQLQKKFKISSCYSLSDSVLAELDECVLLCRRCHVDAHKGLIDVEEEVSCSNH